MRTKRLSRHQSQELISISESVCDSLSTVCEPLLEDTMSLVFRIALEESIILQFQTLEIKSLS